MSKITFLKGDATYPVGKGNKIIVHVCNDVGAWGAGFVLAISKRWEKPEAMYRSLKHLRTGYVLGDVQDVFVTDEDDKEQIIVANMIAQHGIIGERPPLNSNVHSLTWQAIAAVEPPIRYDSVRKCLTKVNNTAKMMNASIHAPRFGTGLAGGEWAEIAKIIKDTITVDVYIYDLK